MERFPLRHSHSIANRQQPLTAAPHAFAVLAPGQQILRGTHDVPIAPTRGRGLPD